MSKRARIHFAANDDHGNFTGRASAFEIELANGERCALALECPVARFSATVRIGGRGGIRVPYSGWQEWVGNMAWDATTIEHADALAVIRWLLEHHATAESYDCDGEIEQLVTAHRERLQTAAGG